MTLDSLQDKEGRGKGGGKEGKVTPTVDDNRVADDSQTLAIKGGVTARCTKGRK